MRMKKILNYVLSPPPNDKLLVTIKRVGIKAGTWYLNWSIFSFLVQFLVNTDIFMFHQLCKKKCAG